MADHCPAPPFLFHVNCYATLFNERNENVGARRFFDRKKRKLVIISALECCALLRAGVDLCFLRDSAWWHSLLSIIIRGRSGKEENLHKSAQHTVSLRIPYFFTAIYTIPLFYWNLFYSNARELLILVLSLMLRVSLVQDRVKIWCLRWCERLRILERKRTSQSKMVTMSDVFEWRRFGFSKILPNLYASRKYLY